LSTFPFGADGDISLTKFKEIYNADLANGLGNLVARVAKLCEIHRISSGKNSVNEFDPVVKECLENFQFNEALKFIWQKINTLDRYLEQKKPWAKGGFHQIVRWSVLIEGIKEIAFNLRPFLPETAEKIEKQFKGPKIISRPPLFLRIL